MLFKAAGFLLFAGAVAAKLAEGTYRITNVASHSTVRARFAGGGLFVSSTRENPGPFELWDIKNAEDGGYTINNVGLNVVLMLDSFAAVHASQIWEPVVTYRDATVFAIESAGQDEYVVKLPTYNLLWNVEPPIVPTGDITLRLADGSATERWVFTKAQWPPEQFYAQTTQD